MSIPSAIAHRLALLDVCTDLDQAIDILSEPWTPDPAATSTRYYERPGDAVAAGMRHGQLGYHVRVGREPGATVWYVRVRPAEVSR